MATNTYQPMQFTIPDIPPLVSTIASMVQPQGQPQPVGPSFAMPAGSQSLDFRAGQAMAPQAYAEGGPVPQPPQMQQPQGGPNPQQLVQHIHGVLMQALQSGGVTPELINTALQMATTVMGNPALYPQLRALAIQRGHISEQDIPPQFHPAFVQALIQALKMALQAAGGPGRPVSTPPPAGAPQMAAGGMVPISASPVNSQSGVRDDVPIRVSGGEFVVPKHVVEAKGTEFFTSLLEKYTKDSTKEGKK